MADPRVPHPHPQPPSRVGASARVLVPIVGVLAVSTAVFALLWLLSPLPGADGRARGRQIAARAGARRLTLVEGGLEESGPQLALETALATADFAKLLEQLLALASAQEASQQAEAFFRSNAGQNATPAVTLTFPQDDGQTETVDLYCVDAQRHLCYGRVGGTGQAVAIPDETYRVLAGVLARLSGDTLGSFALPYHVPLSDAVRQQVGKVQHALVATTVADDARRQLQAAATSGASGAHVTVGRADALTVRATLRLSAGLAMARGVAEALDRASPKITSRHLDAVADAKAVKPLAAAVQHSPEELGDVLVLQVGERSRVLPASTLVSREALPDGSQGPERFAGTDVLTKALADLFADRGRVCFAVGHGERRLETTGGGGLSRSAGRLRGRGFRVSELDLARAATIPKDCAALVLAGPTRPLGAAAEKAIAAYVAAGGRVALMLDPPKGVVPLVALLQRHGIAVPKPTEALVDSRGDLEPGLLLLHLARDTGFTASWTRRPAIFLTGCALTVGDAQVEGAEAMAVARSLDPGAQPPPVLIAASRSTRGKGHKLLVFGDVDVFSNRVLSSPLAPGNLPLLLDALTWLAE